MESINLIVYFFFKDSNLKIIYDIERQLIEENLRVIISHIENNICTKISSCSTVHINCGTISNNYININVIYNPKECLKIIKEELRNFFVYGYCYKLCHYVDCTISNIEKSCSEYFYIDFLNIEFEDEKEDIKEPIME